MRVDLVGVFPPPLGGISVHLERLAARLEARGCEVRRHTPPAHEPHFAYHHRLFLETRGADVVHAHLHGPLDIGLLALYALAGRAVVLTVHAHNVVGEMVAHHPIQERLVRWALPRFSAVVAVSPAIRAELLAAGVPDSRVVVAPAFLPPSRDALLAEQPAPGVAEFMRSHSPVLAANAFSFQRADAGLLYGQDLLIETLAALVPPQGALSNVGLVIHQAQPETAHGHEFAGVQERARALGVQDRVFWVHDSAPFGPTLVRADALLRPTSTDGDAVSVREALHLGVPVVASAVVQRPPGVIAVAEREPTRWALAVTQALAAAAGAPCEVPQDDSFATIWALYQRLTGPSTATPR